MDWPQTITIIASILIPTMAGFAWMISRMDKKFEKVDEEFNLVRNELKCQGERLARIEGAIWSRHTGTGI